VAVSTDTDSEHPSTSRVSKVSRGGGAKSVTKSITKSVSASQVPAADDVSFSILPITFLISSPILYYAILRCCLFKLTARVFTLVTWSISFFYVAATHPVSGGIADQT
jgi:hypothetical protein